LKCRKGIEQLLPGIVVRRMKEVVFIFYLEKNDIAAVSI